MISMFNLGFINFSASAEEIASRLRARINPEVLTCNLHNDNPFDPVLSEPFDIITSQQCIHLASRSVEEYQGIIRRLSKMLKPDGSMFALGSIEENFYIVGNTRFNSTPLTEDTVRKVYESAGFTDIVFQTQMFSDKELAVFIPISDVKGFFLVSAYKNKQSSMTAQQCGHD